MDVIGIICEYNPFHLGHLYHINKIKQMYPDSILIAVLSSSFTQRGDISVLNKWDKTEIALDNGIDLVIELPFVYSTQSADIFAKGALTILNALKVNKIVFGSESNNIDNLKEIANTQLSNKEFNKNVKKYLSLGNNYPTSLSLALKDLGLNKIDSPNDLLGISYIKEIIKNNYFINPISIKRTNNFYGKNKGKIKSASELRGLLNKNKSISRYINYDKKLIYKNLNYFNLLKFQIINNDISNILDVDEGIENKILKVINDCSTLEELQEKIKSKRYTYNKLNRMLTHILCNLKKDDKDLPIDYIRVLGFNTKGKNYLNKIKKDLALTLVTKYKDTNSKLLDIEKKVTNVYSIITNDNSLIIKEKEKPIFKK